MLSESYQKFQALSYEKLFYWLKVHSLNSHDHGRHTQEPSGASPKASIPSKFWKYCRLLDSKLD